MKLFSKENGIVFVDTLTALMVGLAVHQVCVAPMLVKKHQQLQQENNQGNHVTSY